MGVLTSVVSLLTIGFWSEWAALLPFLQDGKDLTECLKVL
jgi:hypothetical protein